MLTLEQLLSLPDAETITEPVTIPGLGTVTVRAISLEAHRSMRSECMQGDQFDWPRWDTLALVNGLAEPEVTYDQALQLRRKAVGVVQDILDAIWRVSGLTERGEIRAQAADDAEASFRGRRDQVQEPRTGRAAGDDGS
jgi:hypothetical protein